MLSIFLPLGLSSEPTQSLQQRLVISGGCKFRGGLDIQPPYNVLISVKSADDILPLLSLS